jgi:hypothetical protein
MLSFSKNVEKLCDANFFNIFRGNYLGIILFYEYIE